MYNFDPETIEGDYAEAFQIWHHRFNKECCEDDSCGHFEFNSIDITTPEGIKMVQDIIKYGEGYNKGHYEM